jgi:uncharacterized protein (UPF0276 family)
VVPLQVLADDAPAFFRYTIGKLLGDSMTKHKLPYLGFGLGLRSDYYSTIIEEKPNVDWFEILTENYLVPGGKALYYLDKIRADFPMVMHGVSLSIGSCDPLDDIYLKQLKALASRIEPKWVSDHLCWTGIQGHNMHDLLPLPYTAETVTHVADRISQVQDFLGRQILIENVSSYVTYTHSEMTEWEFLEAIANKADCLLLLDINNIYVSAFNHEFDPIEYLNHISAERVQQFHLAGHSNYETFLIDTHDAPVISSVWDLYAIAVQRFGPISTMIERDGNIPPLPELLKELNHARNIASSVAIAQEMVQ